MFFSRFSYRKASLRSGFLSVGKYGVRGIGYRAWGMGYGVLGMGTQI